MRLSDTNLQVIFSLTLIAVLGVSSVAPALPEITQYFGLKEKEAGWVITFFTLPGILISPLAGTLLDLFGRKRPLLPFLLLFAAAGTACYWAPDFKTLLILRFIQGCGAAGTGVAVLTLIGDLYSGRERTEIMGINAGVLSIGTALYPLAGGALALLGWNYPFLLSLLALPVAGFAALGLQAPRTRPHEKFTSYLHQVWQGIRHGQILLLFYALVTIFILIYGICLTAFPLWMKESFNASPFWTGVQLTLMSFATGVAAWQLKHIDRLAGKRTGLLAGFGLYAAACLWIPHISFSPLLLIPVLMLGIANGMNVPAIQTLIIEKTPFRQRGAFMSFNGMMLRLGQTLGPLLVSLVLYVGSLKHMFLIAAGISLLTILILWRIEADGRPLPRSKRE